MDHHFFTGVMFGDSRVGRLPLADSDHGSGSPGTWLRWLGMFFFRTASSFGQSYAQAADEEIVASTAAYKGSLAVGISVVSHFC